MLNVIDMSEEKHKTNRSSESTGRFAIFFGEWEPTSRANKKTQEAK